MVHLHIWTTPWGFLRGAAANNATVRSRKIEGVQYQEMTWSPARILFTADFNVPRPGQPVSPSIATLVQNIDRLQLDFDRHVMVHAPEPDLPMTKADLLELAKRTN